MTVDSLIQIIALAVAVYALVPRAKQLEIKVRLGVFWGILFILYASVTILLLYYQQFQNLFKLPRWPHKWLFFPDDVVFFATICLMVGLWFTYQRTKINRRDIFRFQELVEELLHLEEYQELINILNQHWGRLLKIHKNRFLFPRIRRGLQRFALTISPNDTSFDKFDALEFDDLLDRLPKKKLVMTKHYKFNEKLGWKIVLGISKFLPNYSKYSDAADDILQAVLMNVGFIRTMSKVRPYFALKVFETRLLQKEEFTRLYFYYLLRNSQSILYFEIKESQETNRPGGFYIPTKNRLLYYLFNNISNAEQLNIWKPVGDEVINYLEELSANTDDPYNLPMGNFLEDERWNSLAFVGISFFDIMVTNAFFQDVHWHMWLYYYPHFVEKIVKNYQPHSTANLDSEWPTKYSYLLYEIFQNLEDFVKLDEERDSRKRESVIKEIPKHSLIALVHCLQHIFSAENKNMSEQFKSYLAAIVFRLFFDLVENPETKAYAIELHNELFRESNPKGFINDVIAYFQHFPKYDYSEEHIRIFLRGEM